MLQGEQAIRADEAVHRQPPTGEVGEDKRNGATIRTLLSGNLTEHQVVTGKIGHYESGSAFA